MATEDQVRAWVEGFSFMPGWTLSLLDRSQGYPCPVLYIEHATANADEPDAPSEIEHAEHRDWVTHRRGQHCGPAPIIVGSRHPIPVTVLPDREAFFRWLWHELRERMGHEALEWMRSGGRRIFDPHPDNLSRTAYTPEHYLLGA